MDAAARGRIRRIAAALSALAFALVLSPARSAEVLPFPALAHRADAFAGIDFTMDSMFAWAGGTYAPRGRLDQDGLRFRIAGGTGFYRYRNAALPGGENQAQVFAGELLAGYRHNFGPVIASIYGGLHAEQQILQTPDPSNPTAGGEAGLKFGAEIYARFLREFIFNGFATVSTVHGKYNARTSVTREFGALFSQGIWALGVEGGVLGDARASETRLGLTSTLTWQRRIFLLAAGLTDHSDKGRGAYATLSIYAPF